MKIILNFFIVWVIIMFGVIAFQKMTRTEKWKLTKTILFGFVCALIAVSVLSIIVILF